jgi:hypothetical protein
MKYVKTVAMKKRFVTQLPASLKAVCATATGLPVNATGMKNVCVAM